MRILKKLAAGILALLLLLTIPLSALAAEVSEPLSEENEIVVVNNTEGTADTVTVGGLTQGDIVIAYADAELSMFLGADMADDTGVAEVIIDQLIPGDSAGTIYLTIIQTGALESAPYGVHVPAANASPRLTEENRITVTSNALGTDDVISIGNLPVGAVISVYADRLLTERLGWAAADESGKAVVTVPQLIVNDAAGTVYMTVTNVDAPESVAIELDFPAAGISSALSETNTVSITNNATGTSDTIVVTGLLQGDKIKVYTDTSLTALLGSATAAANGIATLSITQIYPEDAPGTVYITVTSVGLQESWPVAFDVPTTGTSAPLTSANTVTIVNNAAGTSDSILVEGLTPGDKIKIYADEALTALLATASATAAGTASVTLPQILPGDTEGTIYITVINAGKPESPAYPVLVPSAQGTPPLTDASIITVTNRAGSADTIVVEGLAPGDRIKVYSDATRMNLLGSAVANTNGVVTVTIPQLMENDGGGNVYLTVTSAGRSESTAYSVTVTAVGQTTALTGANIAAVTSKAGSSDSILLTGLSLGDKIKVYSDLKMTNLIGSATATAAGTANITVAQLIAFDEAGDVYITVTSTGLHESAPFAVAIPAAGVTPALTDANTITVKNNAAGISDSITILGLAAGDKVRVYTDENLTNLIGSATAAATGKAIITVAQLTTGDEAGVVYITVTNTGLAESDYLMVEVPAAFSTAPLSDFNTITVTNNAAGTNDTIMITRLAQGDKVRVYADEALSVLLGSATASAAGPVIVKIAQVTVDDAPGTVYITVANTAAMESTAVAVAVPGVRITSPLSGFHTVAVTNNITGISDTVAITGLSQNDKVKVYADVHLSILLGSAGANAAGIAVVKITQLIPKDAAGTIYITITGTAELESPATAVAVPAANFTPPLSSYNTFSVTNNAAGTNDIITITRLSQGDTIRVYADEPCAILLGTAKVSAAGPVTIKIPQLTLNDAAGTVFITVTNAGKLESTAIPVGVPSAGNSFQLSSGNVLSVANNAGASDVIVVGGLSQNDKIKVYSDSQLKYLLGSANAAATGKATFTTQQLIPGDAAGVVYITVTNVAARESAALAVPVPAANMTAPLSGFSSITVTNNAAGTNDTIVIDLLAVGDKIKVYTDIDLNKVIGTATANASGRAVITVPQFLPGDVSGTVYVTVTNVAARESTALAVTVPPVRTTAPLGSIPAVTNNAAGTNDTIVIEGLVKGDKVKVYADSRLTALLGTATANASGVATLTVRQLTRNDAEDTVYLTVTNAGAKESPSVPLTVPEAGLSAPLSDENPVTVTNNAAGTSDTVVVEGLAKGDKVKVYADSFRTALLGYGTANANGVVTVKITQITARDAAGTVYLTVLRVGRVESTAIPAAVLAAGVTSALSEANTVTVTNNAVGKSDTIVITGLVKGDKVRVYSDSRLINMLGSATANAAGTATVFCSQLIAKDGTGPVYITITGAGLATSGAVEVIVPPAAQTLPLTAANTITVTNNAGKSDIVKITGLTKGDKIKIYSDSKLTRVIGTATVGASGNVTISVSQLTLNDLPGKVYISVTGIGLKESPAVTVDVPRAGTTIALDGSGPVIDK